MGRCPSLEPQRFVIRGRADREWLDAPWLLMEKIPPHVKRSEVIDALEFAGFASRYGDEFGSEGKLLWGVALTRDSMWQGESLDTAQCSRLKWDELLALPRLGEQRECQCGCGEMFEVHSAAAEAAASSPTANAAFVPAQSRIYPPSVREPTRATRRSSSSRTTARTVASRFPRASWDCTAHSSVARRPSGFATHGASCAMAG